MLKHLNKTILAVMGLLPILAWSDVSVTVLDGNGKPMKNAVVFLKSPEIVANVQPMSKVEVAQEDREFIPGLRVVTIGSAVEFPNRDDVRHHVYSFSPSKIFELELYIGKPKAPVVFDKVGIVELGCNIHDNMFAWILVNNTSVFGYTDEQGNVSFPDYEGNEFSVDVWHRDFPYGAPFETFKLTQQGQQPHKLFLKTEGVTL